MPDQTISEPIRILIADAHPLLRAGLQATLTQETDFIVVGEAETDAETQQLCRALQPDVVLLALNLPGPAATKTVTILRKIYPDAKLIILTDQQDDATIRRMMNNGIDGYILKDEAPQTVCNANRAVKYTIPGFYRRVACQFTILIRVLVWQTPTTNKFSNHN